PERLAVTDDGLRVGRRVVPAHAVRLLEGERAVRLERRGERGGLDRLAEVGGERAGGLVAALEAGEDVVERVVRGRGRGGGERQRHDREGDAHVGRSASPFRGRPASAPPGPCNADASGSRSIGQFRPALDTRASSKHTSSLPRDRKKEGNMSNVKPVPEGYHTLTPFLVLKDAHRAIEFYRRAFGAEERFRMPTPDGKVAHAELQIGDSVVMLSEAIQEPVTSASMYLYVPNVDAVCQRAVAAGAEAAMPPTDMFWGDRFGRVG